MSGIFISHASDDKPLIDAFVDNIVKLGCGVPTKLIFYSSGEDTGVSSGSDLNAAVREKVSEVGLVVALLTPVFQTRPFCVAELGAAWSRVDNLFPLKHPQLDRGTLDGVLAGMSVRSFDTESALDELHDRICATAETSVPTQTWGLYKKKWLEALPSLLDTLTWPTRPSISTQISSIPETGTKRWGQLFDSFVDAALYTADDTVARTEILKHADARTLIPSRYLYAGDSGADNWIRLCGDSMYRHYRETTEFWAGPTGREMASRICGELQRNDFDYVSLGSGDGEKDADLVSHWLGLGADIFYYPYDISLPLISRAHRTVREKARHTTAAQLLIKAVLADFNYLSTVSEVFKHRPSPNVVALLGNSLGNLDRELAFLRKLLAVMSSQDLLLLEVRLKSNEERLRELTSVQAMRFDFGPLEHYLGMSFDPDLMTSERVTSLSSIPGTMTTVVACKHESYGEIKLSYIHEYDEKAFLNGLENVGFEVIASKLGKDKDFLVCIARPGKRLEGDSLAPLQLSPSPA